MSEAREAILKAVRQALVARQSLAQRESPQIQSGSKLGATRTLVRPAVAGDCATLFAQRVATAGASLVRIKSLESMPAAIRAFLDGHGLGYALICARGTVFDAVSWPADFTVSTRTPTDGDHTTVTGVLAGVAETGSLVVASAPESPNTLHFLPENHIAVVKASQVLRHLEDVWQLMPVRSEDMPRALTFITGPSRTADVEQTIQIGAHGPRRLHVVLVDS